MPNFGYDEVWNALEESVRLQSYYANLLNVYDDGKRMVFLDSKEWLLRLRKVYKKERRRDERNY